MNESIAKLANQSGFDVDSTGKFGNYSEMHRLEKFAELIVRECADIGERYADGNYEVPRQILSRFGMDEE